MNRPSENLLLLAESLSDPKTWRCGAGERTRRAVSERDPGCLLVHVSLVVGKPFFRCGGRLQPDYHGLDRVPEVKYLAMAIRQTGRNGWRYSLRTSSVICYAFNDESSHAQVMDVVYRAAEIAKLVESECAE